MSTTNQDAPKFARTYCSGVHVREAAEGEPPSRVIAGYAIRFNERSVALWHEKGVPVYEVITREAVTQALLDSSDIKFTMFHNRQKVLARSKEGKGTLKYSLDERGVHFEFEAPHTALGDEALELVKRGDLSACSFMFSADYFEAPDVTRHKLRSADGREEVEYRVNKITGIYDFTLAADPAYPSTNVEARDLSEVLRERAQRDAPEEEAKDEPQKAAREKVAAQVREMREAANKRIF